MAQPHLLQSGKQARDTRGRRLKDSIPLCHSHSTTRSLSYGDRVASGGDERKGFKAPWTKKVRCSSTQHKGRKNSQRGFYALLLAGMLKLAFSWSSSTTDSLLCSLCECARLPRQKEGAERVLSEPIHVLYMCEPWGLGHSLELCRRLAKSNVTLLGETSLSGSQAPPLILGLQPDIRHGLPSATESCDT